MGLLDALARRRFFRRDDGTPILVTRLDGREYVTLSESEAERLPRLWKALIVAWLIALHALIGFGLAGFWIAVPAYLVLFVLPSQALRLITRGRPRLRPDGETRFRVRGRLRGAVGRGAIVFGVVVLAALAMASFAAAGYAKSQPTDHAPSMVMFFMAWMLYVSGLVSLSLDLPTADESKESLPQREIP